MPQYCVYYKLDKNNSSWSKLHLSANSSHEAIEKAMAPFSRHRNQIVLGAPLTTEKREFEKAHGIK
ncbi:Uncharacterised protein [Serratia marcescens]|uniref:hypothetical protein n=1 Tax=Serratia TaxID=613 RepID=UPI000745276C|nr:hypothetical protein [Serratia marcescens]CVE38929.1 Uncharacterised protein [Serratia marcescens]